MSMQLNTNHWKSFYLHEIADVNYGTKLDIGKMTYENPSVYFVSRTALNNGVKAIVNAIDGITPYPPGDITIALGGSIGTTCVQSKPFYTSQNVAVVHFDKNISLEAKLFMCKLIKNECDNKYKAFGRELNSHIKKDFSIFLPQDENGNPDWKFMTDYINSLQHQAEIKVKELIDITQADPKTIKTFINNHMDVELFKTWAEATDCNYKPLDLRIKTWKEFKIRELFACEKVCGKKISDYEEGVVPYVTGAQENNGLVGYVNAESSDISNGNCISVDPITSNACYQPVDFVGRGFSGASINLLYNEHLNPCNSLFIVSAIKKNALKFSYGRLLNGERLNNLVIALPQDKNGNPDWQFMEDYIKSLPFSAKLGT